ncbi:hypothetical protein L1887_51129 [Cichorium endivia]|nr:hypothetical protein L1887_51129 [Cichorium endivia]
MTNLTKKENRMTTPNAEALAEIEIFKEFALAIKTNDYEAIANSKHLMDRLKEANFTMEMGANYRTLTHLSPTEFLICLNWKVWLIVQPMKLTQWVLNGDYITGEVVLSNHGDSRSVYMALLDTNNPTQEQLDLLAETQFIKEPLQLVKPETFIAKQNIITERSGTVASVSGLLSGDIAADNLKLAAQLQNLILKIYNSDSVNVHEAAAVEDFKNGINMYKADEAIQELHGMNNDEHTFQIARMMYVGQSTVTTAFDTQQPETESNPDHKENVVLEIKQHLETLNDFIEEYYPAEVIIAPPALAEFLDDMAGYSFVHSNKEFDGVEFVDIWNHYEDYYKRSPTPLLAAVMEDLSENHDTEYTTLKRRLSEL